MVWWCHQYEGGARVEKVDWARRWLGHKLVPVVSQGARPALGDGQHDKALIEILAEIFYQWGTTSSHFWHSAGCGLFCKRGLESVCQEKERRSVCDDRARFWDKISANFGRSTSAVIFTKLPWKKIFLQCFEKFEFLHSNTIDDIHNWFIGAFGGKFCNDETYNWLHFFVK